jgi:ferredoxin
MGFHVVVHQDDCVSTARCVFDAPGAFTLDDDGLAVALPAADDLDEAAQLRIARQCPNRAIALLDAEGHDLPLD